MTSWKTSLGGILSLVGAALQVVPDHAPGADTLKPWSVFLIAIGAGITGLAGRDNAVTSEQVKAAKSPGGAAPLLLLGFVALTAVGCNNLSYTKDGTRVSLSYNSLFSNSALKGLTVDGTTKTTTNGLRITSSTTEPNAESITASGSALGELIGTAAKAAVK